MGSTSQPMPTPPMRPTAAAATAAAAPNGPAASSWDKSYASRHPRTGGATPRTAAGMVARTAGSQAGRATAAAAAAVVAVPGAAPPASRVSGGGGGKGVRTLVPRPRGWCGHRDGGDVVEGGGVRHVRGAAGGDARRMEEVGMAVGSAGEWGARGGFGRGGRRSAIGEGGTHPHGAVCASPLSSLQSRRRRTGEEETTAGGRTRAAFRLDGCLKSLTPPPLDPTSDRGGGHGCARRATPSPVTPRMMRGPLGGHRRGRGR